jgi:hypothetical protein
VGPPWPAQTVWIAGAAPDLITVPVSQALSASPAAEGRLNCPGLKQQLRPVGTNVHAGLGAAINTTTSMGRLTLNVLLSFAQFEREVTSERIRDKIAASKRKGLWVAGTLPLGYHMKDDKVAVIEDEAERVRLIYRRYLELGGVNALVRDLRERNIRTKSRLLATGATRGGILFGRGSLFYLLRNHFYIGEVEYKDEILPGEQSAIMDRALFHAVQQKLTEQWTTQSTARNASDLGRNARRYTDKLREEMDRRRLQFAPIDWRR